MSDKPEILKCNHCKRAVSKHAMPKHIEGCLNKKQEKQRKKKEAKDARDAAARKQNQPESEDEDEEEGKKTLTGSKKRKAADEAERGDNTGGPAKKKKKKDNDSKPKASRPKAPVDVEKQCGVELPQGGQCARSLTCKSHSMGAKRAVPGRSAPYDKLLMEYQRKNQAKLQKAAFEASGQGAEEDENLPSGPVDEEEERDAVMASIGRSWGGIPIWQPTVVPLREKYQHNRIRGMLQSALGGGGRGAGLFGNGGGGAESGFFGSSSVSAGAGAGAGGGGAVAPVVDEQGVVHARRGSVLPGVRSMMAPSANSKKASLAA